MLFPRVLRIIVIDILAASTVLGWRHVSKTQLLSTVSQNDVVLVAFVARYFHQPWTESSKALEAEWVSATTRTKMPLLSIDCTVESEICQEYGVVSYPAIRLFRGSNDIIRYRGPRKGSAIISFMNRATLPTVSILDHSNITAFISIDETVFIAYILSGDEALKSTFTELAARHHDKYTFGIATETADSMTLPSIVCHQVKEEEEKVLSTQASIDALEKFIEEATAPTIGEFTRRNEMKYMKAGKSLVYYFARTEEERNEYKTFLKPLAKKYKEYLSFVTVDAVEYGHMIPALGLHAGASPALAVFNPMYGQAFPYNQGRKIRPEEVESFVLDIVQGKVQPYGSVVAGPHTEL